MSVDIADFYPLSPMQEGMLFHTLYAPESGFYIEQVCYPVHGNLSATALRQAWQHVVDRHPILRTFFVWKDLKRPVQMVQRRAEVLLVEDDWRSLSSAEQEEKFQAYLQADRLKGFDLAKAPLMRLALFRTGENDYQLIWTWHHLLMDAWSVSILLKEVFTLLQAGSEGRDVHLGHCRPYRDYITYLQQQDLLEAEAFWRRTLKGFHKPTSLRRFSPRETAPDGNAVYGEEQCSLSTADTTALRAYARRHRLTLNTLVQGAWGILLSRYSGESDVVFGTVVSGRPAELEGVESMVGLFINTLPVRVQVTPEEQILSWLKRLQSQQAEARNYEHTPLVQVHGWSDVPRNLPLFESLLAFESKPDLGLSPGASAPPADARIGRIRTFEKINYPLALIAMPGAELTLVMCYDRRCFDSALIAQMLNGLKNLLEGILANPGGRLRELSLLSEGQKKQSLEQCNHKQQSFPVVKCIHQLFEEQVALTPDAIAVVHEGLRLSYAELNARANQLAHYLRQYGVGPESLVGILLDRSLEMMVGIIAVLKAGGAYIPLDPEYPRQRLTFILQDSRASLLLVQRQSLESFRADGMQIICLEAEADRIAEQSAENLADMGTVPDNIAYLIYTSGSTGQPKGVLVSHANVVRLFAATNSQYGFNESDVWTFFHSYAFDFSVWELWGALLYGGKLVMVPATVSRTPEAFHKLVCAERVTVLNQTPSAFRQFMRADEASGATSELALRLVIFGGEALDLQSLQPWFERHGDRWPQLVNMYGITETTVHVTYRPLTMPDVSQAPGSVIGAVLPDLELYVFDEQQQPIPAGVAGELYVGGAGLARGYLGRPELTAERFVPHPFSVQPGARLYRTGDRARVLSEDDMEYLGRIDQQVKIRGFRIELGEIEAVLAKHPAIRESVVDARADANGEKCLDAYIVLKQEQPVTVSELRSYLKEQLPAYMIPSTFQLLDALPLTAHGKLDRQALPLQAVELRALPQSVVGPRNNLELQLIQVWENIFDTSPIGITDNFFDLGGHSFLAVRLMAQIHKQFGVSIPLATLLEAGTVAALAGILRTEAPTQPWSPLVAIQPRGSRPPFFCVHAIGGQVISYYHLARHLGPEQPFYGLQSPGLAEVGAHPTAIEEMAARYIEAIRQPQPDGPYLLGGQSFGGLVAFEMARQLQAAGQEVSLLALFDTWSPAILQTLPGATDDAFLLSMLARTVAREKDVTLLLSVEELRQLSYEQQLEHFLTQVKNADILDQDIPEHTGVQYVHRFLEGYKARQIAMRRYEPATYPGVITLFRCQEQDPVTIEDLRRVGINLEEQTYGWAGLSTEPVQVHIVPGTHETMCMEPHVDTLATIISSLVEEKTVELVC